LHEKEARQSNPNPGLSLACLRPRLMPFPKGAKC
jgi:hypothetical protein